MQFFKRWLSKREPWVFEHSRLPVWLSKVYPIEVNAVSIACFVFCRGELSKTSRRHETIHYVQQLEMFYVGQWLAYAYYYAKGLIMFRDAKKAYYENPFEREAYENHRKTTYLAKRPLWNWKNYR